LLEVLASAPRRERPRASRRRRALPGLEALDRDALLRRRRSPAGGQLRSVLVAECPHAEGGRARLPQRRRGSGASRPLERGLFGGPTASGRLTPAR